MLGWIRRLFGGRRRHGLDRLAARLGMSVDELTRVVPDYLQVFVPKKSGGVRVLHVPDDRTKEVQRLILRRLLEPLPRHDAAFGFEPGRSIAHHAAMHVGRSVVLRYDVVDFFPTTSARRVESLFRRLGWDAEATACLLALVTHAGALPQGAPTSPLLSNVLNRGLDRELTAWIGRRHGRYTRYADDVVVSYPEDWVGTPERTLAVLRRAFARRGYRLHGREKMTVRRRHQRQLVNGLVVNDKVALPRTLRRKLRAARHRVATGREATWTKEQLQGWTAFESMVRRQGAETPEPWRRRGRKPASKRYRP